MLEYIGYVLFSSVKFLVAPLFGFGIKLDFWQTVLGMFAGGILGLLVFFFSASYFLERARLKRLAKLEQLRKSNPEIVPKVFTKRAKRLVRIKRKLGLYGIVFIALPFISIPIEGIVCAKFFKHEKMVLPLLVVSTAIWSILLTMFYDMFYDDLLKLLNLN